MYQLIQDTLMIVFGLVLILILLFALKYVHKQSQRVKDLESELRMTEVGEDAEVVKNQEEQ